MVEIFILDMHERDRSFVKQKAPAVAEASPRHSDVVILHSGSDRIGGVAIQFVSSRAGSDGKDNSLFIDFGALMDVTSRYFGSYAKLPYTAGLRPLIQLGAVPPIPGLYRTDLPNHPTLPEVLRAWEQSANGHSEDGPRVKESVRYQVARNPAVRGVLHTHYHWDHVGNSGLLRQDIPLYTTPITYAVMEAQEKDWGADWLREVTRFRLRNGDREGRSYPVIERPHEDIATGKYINIGGFSVQYLPVSHSAVNACAVDVISPSGNRIHYTGDLRWGEETKAYMRWLDRAEPAAITFVDFTNVGSRKPSLTEDELAKTFASRFSREKGTFFMMVPQRHYERWGNVAEAARRAKRKVYIPLRVAHYLWELQPYRHLDDRIPDIRNFTIYLQPLGRGKYEATEYPVAMRDLAFDESLGLEVVELGELARLRKEDAVVLFTSKSQMTHFYSHGLFPASGHYLHAASDAYDENGVIGMHEVRRLVKEMGYAFEAAHASGHFSEDQIKEFLRHVRSPVVAPIHTKDPKLARDLIERYCPHGPRILWQIRRGIPYTIGGKLVTR